MSTSGGEQVREHAFDGIEELDNRLPNWWLWSFYLAVIFSFFYWVHYHVLGTGALPKAELSAEQEAYSQTLQARLDKEPVTDASLLKMAGDPVTVKKGEAIFKNPAQCAMCHRADGGGQIGPNLTDRFWIHGCRPMDLYKTIGKGVPEKGMAAWEPLLGASRVQQVTAYLLAIQNTNVVGGKAPEGQPQGTGQ